MSNALVGRWQLDPSRPEPRQALRDVAVRVLAPAVVLFGAIVGLGLLIVGPLGDPRWEDGLSASLEQRRTATWDAVTRVWSLIGNTEVIIGVCVVAVGLIWWRTKQWWVAIIPAIAISVQAAVFVGSSAIVGRDRPQVRPLDPAPPTSSYPSGHAGAAVALYLTFALLAQRIEQPWLRRLVTGVCLVIPILVAVARLYRGMHHLLDIVIGILNGLCCAALAWNWLRRKGP